MNEKIETRNPLIDVQFLRDEQRRLMPQGLAETLLKGPLEVDSNQQVKSSEEISENIVKLDRRARINQWNAVTEGLE